jgi:hypothetical protein
MTAVTKQDSNSTGLRFAVEDTPGHVPADAIWYPLEPNSYKNFGSSIKTKQRMPINSSRQLSKGVVVDEDALAGFAQDLTFRNSDNILQSMLYALQRTKNQLAVATVDSVTPAYQPASGGDALYAGDLLAGKDFTDSANDGLKVVTGTPTAASVPVSGTLVAATGQAGTLNRVGFQFASGDVEIDVTGTLPKLKSVAAQAAATGVLTGSSNFADTETVTIGGKVYTFQSALTNVDGHVLVGADLTASLLNLRHAINGTGGTDYALATVAHAKVTATASDATTLTVTAKASGAIGNAITTTESAANAAWGGATLSGGTGARGFDTFGIIPGEFVFVGGDATAEQFATANCNGFCRVRSVAAGYLEFDKTQFAMSADAGTGKTIRLFMGRVLKNESDATLIVKRALQFERTLGAPDDSLPTQIQAEYITAGIADTATLDMKTADIVTVEYGFLGNTQETRTGAEGVKPGTRPTLAETDAFNSTSDVAFTKMAVVTAGNPAPSPLFSFFTDLQIGIKNNVKQNKAVSVLGTFSSTPGFFQVSGNVTAYFTDVAEIAVVKNNDSVTLETHLVKSNQGITVDLPLVVLSNANAEVKINEPIMMPLNSDAARATSIDPSLDYTMLMVFWDYLPNLAG